MTTIPESPKVPTLADVAAAVRVHVEHRAAYHGHRYVPTGKPLLCEPDKPVPGNNSTSDRAEGGPRNEGGKNRTLRQEAESWNVGKKLAYLRERSVGNCQRCPLARTRNRIVFGTGNGEASLMIIGEAPGADEDREGVPFVGAAGRKLTSWIETLSMTRDDVYIANILKCRPPGNRDPQPQEVQKCSPFLAAQIRAIRPRVIVALGRHAGCLLLQRDSKLYEMRGRAHNFQLKDVNFSASLVVTYHPSYVLRREGEQSANANTRGHSDKNENELVLNDLKFALDLMKRPE